MRRSAKAVNFGVIYGQSPFGLAKQLDIDQAEAAAVHRRLLRPLSGGREISEFILEDCPKTGYVSTILGRRRAISGIRRGVSRQRNLPERTAINTVIQGSAADLIKLAMINVHRRLRQRKIGGEDAAANPRRISLRSSFRRARCSRRARVRRNVDGHESHGSLESRFEIGRQLGGLPGVDD